MSLSASRGGARGQAILARALIVLFCVGLGRWPVRAGDLPQAPPREAALLQIRVVDGEGAVQALGARSARPISVQVTDETGRPVAGAAVSFRLPDDGPSGVFASGMKTEVAVTAADGRASVWGIQWNRTAGPLQIRVTTVKGQSRAGAVISQYVSDAAPAAGAKPELSAPGRGHGRWLYTALVITAGAVAGGAAIGMSRYSKSAQSQPAAAATMTAPPTQVGAPSISIGKP